MFPKASTAILLIIYLLLRFPHPTLPVILYIHKYDLMKPKIIIPIILVTTLLGVAVYLFTSKQSQNNIGSTHEPTLMVPVTERDNPTDEEIAFTTSTIQEESYQLSLTAPKDLPPEVQNDVDQFFAAQKEAFLDIAEDPQMTEGSPYPFTLATNDSEVYRYGQFTSYVTQFEQYTGGAHGNNYYYTVVYDSSTGKKIELTDLFKEPAHAYTYLSQKIRPLVVDEVLRNSGISKPTPEERDFAAVMAEDGTAPRAENFERWYLNDGKLMVIFPPYHVASYAAGTQIVGIPLNQMMTALNSEILTSTE